MEGCVVRCGVVWCSVVWCGGVRYTYQCALLSTLSLLPTLVRQQMPTFRPAALAFFRANSKEYRISFFTIRLKKARAAGRNVGICCLIKVGKRESVLNMQEPTEKLPLQCALIVGVGSTVCVPGP